MFDYTIFPIMNLWGFGPNKNAIKKTFSTLSPNGSVYYIGCDQIYLNIWLICISIIQISELVLFQYKYFNQNEIVLKVV